LSFKEVLGNMMQQEKEKKEREKAMHKQGMSIDQHTWNTFVELEKAQEQEEKRRVKDLLLKDLDEARRREEEKKTATFKRETRIWQYGCSTKEGWWSYERAGKICQKANPSSI